jgi:sialic acid synthase SpsE
MVKGRGEVVFPPVTPYLVAAIDYNHNGSAALARRLVALASEAGAHAVKFAFRESAPHPGLRPSALAAVRGEAKGKVAFVAAPYDLASFAQADRLAPDIYQIDPPALSDRPLLEAAARSGKPILLVAGMCTDVAIAAALGELREKTVVLLHSVSALPLAPARTHLAFIGELNRRWRVPVGYAGWEPGTTWAVVAAALGAIVIEKPFTLDRNLGGPFHAASLDPQQLRTLADDLNALGAAIAPVKRRRILPEELDVLGASGQSLVARRRLRRGTRLRSSDFKLEAPLRGLTPRLWSWLEGRRLIYDLEAGEPITFGMVE